jgi:5'(3')-deoxyribonucleotidase/uncharacterized protein with PQ loop repeat
MSSGHWVTGIGTAAALFTTLSFVPQLVKIQRQGGRDLSWGMLTGYLTGQALWFTYGVLLRAPAVIAANAATFVLVAVAIAMKFRSDRGRWPAVVAPPARRLRIAIDMDEVIADSLGEHLRRYNAAFGTRVVAADLKGRSLEAYVPAEHLQATLAMLDESFFDTLVPIDGAIDAIRQLHARHEVFIATAAMDVPVSFAAKYRWMQAHLPFILPSHIVFCGDKAVVDADVLIDDSPRHFARFKGRGLLYPAPHNAHESRYERVNGWRGVLELLVAGRDEEAAVVKRQAA